ncbi:MotA/TolQ/ExbB proton channel family protein [Solimonas variicoloris]|uniref:MotA/TolQ/ExbB proton channel family protein n=1 Tax=Solimonas variicoloris TaxID=254408 RepID=UPI0003740442|nr:MotA/TolQ/ExbB proton channel family protein [Solimonas variicoloris]
MDFFVTILHFFQKGGFMMYPIAIVLALSVAIAIERWLFLSRVERENRKIWQDAVPLLAKGDLATVEQLASGSDAAVARIFTAGAAQAKVDPHRNEVETATEEALMEVLPAVEKRTHYLATFSNMSTLLGLLGTVIGLIGAFAALGTADPTEKADLLSRGISEAMNCTAFGLLVAIPTLLVHAWLQAKTTELVDRLEAACAKFVSAAARK